ncbi:MAG TPA: signal peptidase I [Candidatus Binatia bacterium]|nr:signal peptidase I [Candidatus Binatia bacterium]
MTVMLGFAAGWFLHDTGAHPVVEQTQETVPIFAQPGDVPSPAAAVDAEDIRVLGDRVELRVPNVIPAEFTDTNSMDPVIDAGTTALELTITSVNQVHVGDIVSYETPLAPGATVIHRVVEIGTDEDGTYFIMKGDNNPTTDPQKVRFDQLRRKVIAIVY